MVMAPSMVHPKKEDLSTTSRRCRISVELPMLLYNNPQDTGNDLPFDLVERLADLDHIVAIKDSTFDFNVFWKTQCALARPHPRVHRAVDDVRRACAHDGRRRMGRYLLQRVARAHHGDLSRRRRTVTSSRARRLQKTGAELRSVPAASGMEHVLRHQGRDERARPAGRLSAAAVAAADRRASGAHAARTRRVRSAARGRRNRRALADASIGTLPNSCARFSDMAELFMMAREDNGHERHLIEGYRQRFGEHIPAAGHEWLHFERSIMGDTHAGPRSAVPIRLGRLARSEV